MSRGTIQQVPHQEWHTPLDLGQYDRNPALTTDEQQALSHVMQLWGQKIIRFRTSLSTTLIRLLKPLDDILALLGADVQYRSVTIRVILMAMGHRGTSFWAWPAEEWSDVICSSQRTFGEQYRTTRTKVRAEIIAIAYLVSDYHDFYTPPGRSMSRATIAERVFGKDLLEHSTQRLCALLAGWGYAPRTLSDVRYALCVIFLVNRSPYLEDISYERLLEVQQRGDSHITASIYAIARALTELGLLQEAFPKKQGSNLLTMPGDTSTIHPTWLHWCDRWKQNAIDLAEQTRSHDYHSLLKCGRWLAVHHPEIASPEQWTNTIAAEWVSAVDAMCIGDFGGAHSKSAYRYAIGKPLMPRSKYHILAALRRFFHDLQDEPFTIARRFNPDRLFRTPGQVMRKIGPAPRDIKALTWARLIEAATSLTENDLMSSTNNLLYPLPLVKAVAVVWCYAGLRGNEIRRLRIGCIRYQEEEITIPETGEVLPKQAVCFLTVPVTKTNTMQVKPVNLLVGKSIREWEAIRPKQPSAIDHKTGEYSDLLFSFRGQVISEAYLNRVLIPLLCSKAGVPNEDERGKFTSHRARATIATLLYNAPEGLTLEELATWLGHRHLSSTQHYAALKPNRLAVAYTRAEENSVLISTVVDLEGGVNNRPKVYTVLDDGGLCGNPEWVTCPVRMACKKCQFHVPTEVARVIVARKSVRKMLQIIELLPEERTALEEDERHLTETIQRAQKQIIPRVLYRRKVDGGQLEVPLADFFTEESQNI